MTSLVVYKPGTPDKNNQTAAQRSDGMIHAGEQLEGFLPNNTKNMVVRKTLDACNDYHPTRNPSGAALYLEDARGRRRVVGQIPANLQCNLDDGSKLKLTVREDGPEDPNDPRNKNKKMTIVIPEKKENLTGEGSYLRGSVQDIFDLGDPSGEDAFPSEHYLLSSLTFRRCD